jgi:uncharacterized protein
MREINRRQSLTMIGQSLATSLLLAAVNPLYAVARQKQYEKLSGKKVLFFSKSAGFEHDVSRRMNDGPSFAERVISNLAKSYDFEITLSKDGTIFDKDHEQFDCYYFYTSGDLCDANVGNADREPPMSAQGKQNLLDAIVAGKGFVGNHCASDTFHSQGDMWQNQAEPDPYIKMIGGEFCGHGQQQSAEMKIVSPQFPGANVAESSFKMIEEWYSLRNFAPDMHAILVQETSGMPEIDYQRPAFPATWARTHEKGRVFYSSMGHREDVWVSPTFESIMMGGLAWACRAIDYDVTPNLQQVAPKATELPKR